jgi:sugar transferase (PEP-CTERM/EpsH1 system associated)
VRDLLRNPSNAPLASRPTSALREPILFRTSQLATSNCVSLVNFPEAARPTGAFALRILHVVDRLGTGGTEYGILKIIEGLSDQGFEHQVCAVRGSDNHLVRAHHLENKVYVVGRSRFGYQSSVNGFVKIARRLRPHIVHSRNWGAIEAIPAARLAGVPLVIHSEHGYELEMLTGLPARQRLFRRAAYSMADVVFTVTQDLRHYHAKQAWVSKDRIRVLPNGVDTARFAPRPLDRAAIRQRLGIPVDALVLGTVGRLVKIKKQDMLLGAAEILLNRGVSVYVVLAGSGPELCELQKLVAASPNLAGRVLFLGFAENVPEILNAMDVFVLPSLDEGMSNTLLEAMASQLPIVATHVGGNPELIEENRSGWLVQPGNLCDLVTRLEILADDLDLRVAIGRAARERAVSYFSLKDMIDRYRSLYVELAGKRGILVGSQVPRQCAD